MPVRNEGAYLEKSLNSVLTQDYPEDRYEIIVADGMSDDGTKERLLELQKKNSKLYVIDNPGKIVSPGLNAAVRAAKGEIIVRVDGHCEIAPDYVSRCVRHLKESGAAGVGGPIETIGEDSVSQAIALAMSSHFGVGGSAFRVGVGSPEFVDTVAFPAYPKEILLKAGPFDDRLVRNQDDEYNYRLRKMGYKLLLAPDVKSKYYSRSSLLKLWSQYFQYGFWKVSVLQKHPAQMKMRQFVPPLFVFALAITAAAAFFFPIFLFWFCGLLAVYLLADFAASLMLAAKRGWKFLFLMPVIFLILHLSYGAGFWTGAARFFREERRA